MATTGPNVERYLKGRGTHCLYCGSVAVFADEDFRTDENLPHVVTNRVECDDCHKVWIDIYTLTAIRGVEE